jgi:hypothetical protein
MTSETERLEIPSRPTDWAVLAPLLCTAHCLAAPLAVAVLPGVLVGTGAELLLMAGAAATALVVLGRGVRAHRRRMVWLPAAAGLALWATVVVGMAEAGAELAAGMVGGLLLAGSLGWNGRLRHEVRCRGCGCSSHPA